MGRSSKIKMPWCSVAATLKIISGRWKPWILFHLKDQPRRFNDLRRRMPQITQRMLTLQLRALEADGVVSRKVLAGVPSSVEYALTGHGQVLGGLVDQIEKWGERYAKRDD
jgi:DNA-binding HxlR family transcriptional regulator